MNTLFVSIDSLRRDFLSAYGESPAIDVATPNFDRFAERAAVFDSHYAGSLPCMPARREWLTGTQEFLWRPWGPIEPFDNTLPELARQNGILSQLITDHYHYFQHGSNGYYEDFNGFDFVRGHEYDAWQTSPMQPDDRLLDQTVNRSTDSPEMLQFLNRTQYARNVSDVDELAKEEFFAPQIFSKTSEWLQANQDWAEWFCYVDSFDVHEPFHVPEPYASLYTDEDPRDPDLPNWPYYGQLDEGQSELSDREAEFVRSQFAGKVTMVDEWFGQVLDTLDHQDAWEDTVVIITSDHGFMLGEHNWMGKNAPPVYNILAHTPLMIWHPKSPHRRESVSALTSAVDLYATVLDIFGIEEIDHRHSQSMLPLLCGETDNHRDWALYGYWGSAVNVTDGQHTYHRPCQDNAEVYCYSTTMMNPNSWFTPTTPELDAEANEFLPYTDSPVWRYPGKQYRQLSEPLLFDVTEDWYQHENLNKTDDETAQQMQNLLISALDQLKSPEYQYKRLGFVAD